MCICVCACVGVQLGHVEYVSAWVGVSLCYLFCYVTTLCVNYVYVNEVVAFTRPL